MEEIVRLYKTTYDGLKRVEKDYSEKLDALQKKYDELNKSVEQGDKYVYHKFDPYTGDRTFRLFTKDEILQEQLKLITNRTDEYERKITLLQAEKEGIIASMSYTRNENSVNIKKIAELEKFQEKCKKSKLFWLIKLFNNL